LEEEDEDLDFLSLTASETATIAPEADRRWRGKQVELFGMRSLWAEPKKDDVGTDLAGSTIDFSLDLKLRG